MWGETEDKIWWAEVVPRAWEWACSQKDDACCVASTGEARSKSKTWMLREGSGDRPTATPNTSLAVPTSSNQR